MGGAVSSGRDNNELIDNLMGGNYIRTRCVERVFRVLDRADYMTPEARDQAYKDLAWRNGPLHMSAPCIYSEVMEGLQLSPGLSFLNIGSGTGYLSTLVGLILGSGGISHGVEVHPMVHEYSVRKLSQFLDISVTLDEFDFCVPKFYCGNGLCVAPLPAPYDRVYVGAGCPDEYLNYFKQLIKVGGILVMPLNDNLVQVRRVAEHEWVSRGLLNVSFAMLRVPTKEESANLLKLDEQCPPRLQELSRASIRGAMRGGVQRRQPELREPPPRPPPPARGCPRRICIPLEDDSDLEGLNALHDLDRDGGANEMNALLSLVLSMGHNRVAGALRFDRIDSPASSEDGDDEPAGAGDDDDEDDDDDGDGNGDGDANGDVNDDIDGDRDGDGDGDGDGDEDDFRNPVTVAGVNRFLQRALDEELEHAPRVSAHTRRGVLTFELRDSKLREEVEQQPPESRLEPRPEPESEPTTSNCHPTCTETEQRTDDNSVSESEKSDDRKSSKKRGKMPDDDRRLPEKGGRCSKQARKSADRVGESGDKKQKKLGGVTRTARGADRPDEDDDDDMPSEVEIYLGKTGEGPSTSGSSGMDWLTEDCTETKEEGRGTSDDDITDTMPKDKEKRQKLDSGLGEETSPSSGSSPAQHRHAGECATDSSAGADADGEADGDGDSGGGDGGRDRSTRAHAVCDVW